MGIGAAIAAGVAVAAGVGGGLASASAKKKGAKKMRKEADRSYVRDQARIEAQRLGGMADARRTAGNIYATEQARVMLQQAMGRPGSYDDFPTTAGPIGLGSLAPQGVGGLGISAPSLGVWTTKKGEVGPGDVEGPKGGANKYTFDPQEWESQGYELDPNAIAGAAMDSQGFKNISRMTAEAGQLLAGKGDLYNKLTQSIVGGTFGATAARARVVDEEMARAAARGGNEATSAALKFAARARAQEEINRTHVNALWQSKLQMEGWARNYAGQVQNLGQDWLDNAAGVRDVFNNMLNNAQNFWTNVMIPTLMPQSQRAADKQGQSTAVAQELALEAKLQKISTIANGVKSLGSIVGGGISGMGGGLGGGMFSSPEAMHAAGVGFTGAPGQTDLGSAMPWLTGGRL